MLRLSLINLLARAKWFHVRFWNKWRFLHWFFPVWIQGLSEQWSETSSLGAPERDDPCFGAVWGVWRLTSLDWIRNPGSVKSPFSPPPEVLEAKGSISPRKLFTHLLWAPDPFGKTPMAKLLHYTSNRLTKPKPHTSEALCRSFKWLCWTEKGNSSLKPGDLTVPDGSAFTALPPASYLLSFSNNTLTAWQLSRAV